MVKKESWGNHLYWKIIDFITYKKDKPQEILMLLLIIVNGFLYSFFLKPELVLAWHCSIAISIVNVVFSSMFILCLNHYLDKKESIEKYFEGGSLFFQALIPIVLIFVIGIFGDTSNVPKYDFEIPRSLSYFVGYYALLSIGLLLIAWKFLLGLVNKFIKLLKN